MGTRFRGTFIISWAQAELDGLAGTSAELIAVGSTWRWHGRSLRVDDQRDVLVLENAEGLADSHRRAASKIRRFLGDPALSIGQVTGADPDQPLFRYGFELTDGREKFQATLIDIENGNYPMLLFIGSMPPVDQDLWVLSCNMPPASRLSADKNTGTICFTPHTRIKTPDGSRQVCDLREGDLICTKDSGAQAIRWIGDRQVTGARLMAMPHLSPVRIAANVLAEGEPDEDLIVSPDHRLLVKGSIAQALFNTSEVLVAARDLINDSSIRIDRRLRSVTYVHLMLDQHQIVWANGVEVESFHPAGMGCKNISPRLRDGLQERFPHVRDDGLSYGEYVRRNLTRSEAAILSYGSFVGH